jgi:tetratricopeptide (TPR) repeat protein
MPGTRIVRRVAAAALAMAALTPAASGAAERGDIVPFFKAVDLLGRPVHLGELVARRRVVVFFWDWRRATSARAMQVLDRLQSTYGERGLEVLAVEGEGASADQVLERVEKLRSIGNLQRCVVIPDPGGRIGRQFRVSGTPQVYVLDGAGRVFEHFEQLRAEDDALLERRVLELFDAGAGRSAPAVSLPAAAVWSSGPAPAPAPATAPATAPEDPGRALLEKYRYFGGYHLNKGEPAKAEEYFRKYVELAPGDAAAWLRLGEACVQQGRRDAAREAWERVLRIEPGNAEADANIRRLVRGEY